MEENWAPLNPYNGSRFSIVSPSVASNTTYDPADGHIVFDIKNEAELDPETMVNGDPFHFSLKAPEGAKSFRATFWERQLYGSLNAEGVEAELDTTQSHSIAGSFTGVGGVSTTKDGILFTLGGYLLRATELAGSDGLTIYTVPTFTAGYGQIMVIQWYDEDGGLIQIGDKYGEFIYLTTKPYFKESGETEVLPAEPQQSYEFPVAVATETTGAKLKTEIPLQTQNGQDGWNYLYMIIKYLDASGQEVEPQPGHPVTVFIPFPEGMTADNAADYQITLRHYTKPDHSEYEEFSIARGNLEVTPYGLKASISSFSPFLLGYKEASASSSSSSSSGSGSYGIPVILSPVSETIVPVSIGQQASLSLTSSGGVTFQWYRYGNGWEAISGASQSRYLTPSVTPANNGDRYFCRVSNGYGHVDSPVFRLQVGISLVPPKTGDRPTAVIYLAFLIPCAIGIAAIQRHKRNIKAD